MLIVFKKIKHSKTAKNFQALHQVSKKLVITVLQIARR